MVAAARSTARFRYRSAVADPFSSDGPLAGWEDVGMVDVARQVAWYRRAWKSPTREETVGILRPDGMLTLGADGGMREVPGALHLLNATSNPLGLLRLLDPAFTTANPSGPGRWRIQIDVTAARRALGAASLGPSSSSREATLAATAEVRDGHPSVVAAQVGIWGEPQAWVAVRFFAWGSPVPEALGEAAVSGADFDRLRSALMV